MDNLYHSQAKEVIQYAVNECRSTFSGLTAHVLIGILIEICGDLAAEYLRSNPK